MAAATVTAAAPAAAIIDHAVAKAFDAAGASLGAADRALAASTLAAARDGTIDALEAWRRLARDVLRPEHPFELHQALHAAAFRGWDEAERGPAPVWVPSDEDAAATNVAQFMARFEGDPEWASGRTGRPAADWPLLQRFSCRNPEAFWAALLMKELGVAFDAPPRCILDAALPDAPPDSCVWLPGARLNIADAALRCPRAPPGSPAIVWAAEGAPRDVRAVGRAELRRRCLRVAARVAARFPPGSALAVAMPMTVEAVVIYLGVILAGCSVVSIADSFAAGEIAARLRIAGAAAVFTQDAVLRGGRALPLYARVAEAGAPLAVVLAADGDYGGDDGGNGGGGGKLRAELREGDVSYSDFLGGGGGGGGAGSGGDAAGQEEAEFVPRVCDAHAVTNILFSSGTTGEPKAIPWTHVTPLRCAADAWAHQDVRPGSVVAWPTNLGWMMGPWLVYAALLNGGTIALYQARPGRGGGRGGRGEREEER